MSQAPDPDILSQSSRGEGDWSLARRTALLGRFARDYLRRHVAKLAGAGAAMAVYAGSVVALPALFEQLVDGVLVAKDPAAVTSLVLLVVGIFVVRGAASFLQQYLLAYVGNAVSLELQRAIAARLLSLDLVFFGKNSIGQLISRATDDVTVLNRAATSIVVMAGRDAVTLLGLLVYVLWSNPLWFLLGAVAAPLMVVPVSLANRKLRALARRGQDLTADILQAFEEALHAVRTIKAENLERVERERLDGIVTNRRKVALRFARTQAMVLPIVDFVTALALVAVILVGGHQVTSGEADPGSLVAFVGALLLLYEPLRRLMQFNAQLQAAAISIHRIYEVLDRRPAIVDRPGAVALSRPGGAIRFEEVTFGYEPGAPVLRGFTAELPEGATTAIVGASGSGKTTLFNLLARLFEPSAGRILIGEQDVSGVTLNSLRDSLALVSQDVLLFDASVFDNIAYGKPDATPAAVEAAARAADAHAFVCGLPEQYRFRVGPRGSRLSGGQRQRIALARALLRDAPLLLLDEATSALDSESERRVQASLAAARVGRTTLVIAHRLASITHADRILVLEGGRLVEQGTHEILLRGGGAYARLFARQSAAA